ncbi:MAG: DEAD/DEAH box helicase [Microbacterium sp.]|uniref:DEAD/DEAH box helicase n=1 Tax=Microbacterium sp. TaxID=51671 RepID=UPI001AC08BDD|nr:DEAD/DEAH box helicase [Microbacterium sp.]MBN9214132.1 DEAD/DEAH box helicase [Microbacterium sp.]
MSFSAAPGAPIIAPTRTGWATLGGTFREPVLEVHIHSKLPHPTIPKTSMLEWIKSLGNARWNPHEQSWIVSGLNSHEPALVLAQAGIDLHWDDRPAEFADVVSIDELAWPIAKLSDNKRTVLVRARLAGFDYAKELLGFGAVWDKDRRFFRTPVSDVLVLDGRQLVVRPGIHWPQNAIEAAHVAHAHVPVPHHLESLARKLGSALSTSEFTDEELSFLQTHIGDLPTDGRAPFEYQKVGSLAVAAGRACLFDEPGVGKTAGALLAARILAARRTVIVVPPLLTTNWRREIGYAALCTDEHVVTFKPGRKEPQLPQAGAVIISDSLLASRPAVLERLIAWQADVMIVDEAHRIKTIGSARGDAVLDLGASVKYAPFALTGTPIFASPHEMVTMLELTRMLAPVFGGRHQFLADFCIQDRFGGWKPRKTALHRLHATLVDRVWVRRRKRDVLPQLPKKMRERMLLEVPLKQYRETHKEVIAKVQAFLTWFEEQNGREPTSEELSEWVQFSSFTLISQLRQAAGLAKIPLAAELIEDHINQTGWETDEHGRRVFHRPLLVWVHHRSVAAALYEALPASIGETGMIGGATSDTERDRLVDDFQAGLIPVLLCSITKAGVGLTLTRGSDAIFAETDWTPALIKQAEDRQHRPGATGESVQYTTLIAVGTLDETIQNVLGRKVEILEKGIGDTDDSVAVLAGDDARGLRDIVDAVVEEALRTRKRAA